MRVEREETREHAPGVTGGADDADFEARLAALKTAKGQTPFGQGKKKDAKADGPSSSGSSKRARSPKTPKTTLLCPYYVLVNEAS